MAGSKYPRDYGRMLQRLRKAREAAGLTQVEVADALGFSQLQVSRIERGQRRLDPIELARLAKLYGQPVTDFIS